MSNASRFLAWAKPRGVPTFAFELPINLAALAALGALVWTFRSDSFTLNILASAFLFAGLATAWNIVGGYCGQFSLGHSVFFATGAYTTANLYLKFQARPDPFRVVGRGLGCRRVLAGVSAPWAFLRLRDHGVHRSAAFIGDVF